MIEHADALPDPIASGYRPPGGAAGMWTVAPKRGAARSCSPGVSRAPTAGISLSMVDGAVFENVVVSNVIIRDAKTPLFLRLRGRGRGRGQAVPTPGRLSKVVFSNIMATGGSLASSSPVFPVIRSGT